MDEVVLNAIEIVANVLYLIEHYADDPERVRQLTEMTRSSMEILLRHAAKQNTDQFKSRKLPVCCGRDSRRAQHKVG